MANKMTGIAETGLSNPKFIRRRKSDGAFWNTSGTPAFEAYSAGNIASYGIAGTESGATGIYTATDPSDTTEGDYALVGAAGASLATGDLPNNIRWQNDAGPRATDVQSILGTALTEGAAGRLAGGFKQFFNIASPTATMDHLILVDTATTVTGGATAASQSTILTAVAGVQSDTDDIQARLPAALTANGLMKADTLRVGGTLQTANDLGAKLDVIVSTRASATVAPSWYTAPVDVSANVTAIKAKTDNLPASPAAVGSAMVLSSTGLNLVLVAGQTMPDAIKWIGAALVGKNTGAGTGTETYKDFAGTAVVVATIDTDGNRTNMVLS